MKGDDAVIAMLNEALSEELTAINQYIVHAEMCENWGYEALHDAIQKQAIDEMHHVEWLIARVLFLEGIPIVSKLHDIHIGTTVADIVGNDLGGEYAAVKMYNAGIALAEKNGDVGTRDLLTRILKMEEDHVDWGEAQRDQIGQMGLSNYLAQQIAKA